MAILDEYTMLRDLGVASLGGDAARRCVILVVASGVTVWQAAQHACLQAREVGAQTVAEWVGDSDIILHLVAASV